MSDPIAQVIAVVVVLGFVLTPLGYAWYREYKLIRLERFLRQVYEPKEQEAEYEEMLISYPEMKRT